MCLSYFVDARYLAYSNNFLVLCKYEIFGELVSIRSNRGLNSIALTLLDHLMRGAKRTVLILITESMQKQHFSRVDNCSHVYTLRVSGIVMRFVCDFFSIPASFVAQLLMRYQRNLFAYFCFHAVDSANIQTRIKIGIVLTFSILDVRYIFFCYKHAKEMYFMSIFMFPLSRINVGDASWRC